MTSITRPQAVVGCLFGQFVGDACGATLEFYRGDLTDKVLREAMMMPGGGALNVGPGQITDDSELAIHLFRALKGHSPFDGFPIEDVAKEYIAWHKSMPFDIGMTCNKAFAFTNNAQDMMSNARKYSAFSEANGSLMRISPLAIWARDAGRERVMDYARQEARLSHPNQVCQDANAVFCVALACLFEKPGDVEHVRATLAEIMPSMDPKIKEWYKVASSRKTRLDRDIVCNTTIGHVKHAFTLAFFFLFNGHGFEDALFETLKKGGDTDTNAAIVCAMMGARYGMDAIPKHMVDAVLNWDCTSEAFIAKHLLGNARPETYRIQHVLRYIT